MTIRLALVAAAVLFAAPTVARAAQAGQPADGRSTDRHAAPVADILVTGIRRNSEDVLGGASVLSGAELTQSLRPSLGETLAHQPGVSASSFGPTASRPILRGLSGDRIRILTDGIGSLDVSSSSADHAVAINPLTADRIEVLRGPVALLFGSSAIGGVVNIIDSRIPRRLPERPFHADGLGSFGTAANERSANLVVDLPVGRNFVVHGDGNWSKSDDLEVGGHLLSAPLRRQARASSDPAVRALADLDGTLDNSSARASEYATGFAYLDGAVNAGVSVTRHTALYGVPIRYSLDPAVDAEAPQIDMRQTRYDARFDAPLGGAFTQLRGRAGYARYRHDELDPEGVIGSSFFTRGGEGRVELVQAVRRGWGGDSGIQAISRRVSIRGEEKFLPDSRQRQIGLFTVQHRERGPLRFEAGARYERTTLAAREDSALGNPDIKRRFATLSLGGGAAYALAPGWKMGVNLSRSARAPSIDELFANGPHAGTQAFERGDTALRVERSLGIDASMRYRTNRSKLALTIYRSEFSNFIYQAPTGEIVDDLPVFAYRQGRATYTGFEAELEGPLGRAFGLAWSGDAIADAVRAKIRHFGPAPQIPPLRILAGLDGQAGRVGGRLEIEHSFAQHRNAPLETKTRGFTLINGSLDWRPLSERPELSLIIAGNNLLDSVARRHSSLLKDHAPLAGRDIRLTAKMTL